MRASRILIVEDHAFQRRVLQQTVEQLGATSVQAVDSASDALALLRQDGAAFDAVLLDLMLPGMDGIELIAQLARAARHVPVVLMSADPVALDTAATIARARGLSVLGAVSKPITVDKLRAALEQPGAAPS